MRHILRVIALAISIVGLSSCTKSVHSIHWYEQHAAARKATNEQCNKSFAAQIMQSPDSHMSPNCRNASDASNAIRQAAEKKWMKRWEHAGPYKVFNPATLPPVGSTH